MFRSINKVLTLHRFVPIGTSQQNVPCRNDREANRFPYRIGRRQRNQADVQNPQFVLDLVGDFLCDCLWIGVRPERRNGRLRNSKIGWGGLPQSHRGAQRKMERGAGFANCYLHLSLCSSVPLWFNPSGRSIGHSFDAVFEQDDVEVNQQTNFFLLQFEIGKQLCLVKWDHLLDGFEFNDDFVLDKQI